MSAARRPLGVAILGSTGSIGTQALEVIAAHPGELRAVALVAGHASESLAAQARLLRVPALAAAESTPDAVEALITGDDIDIVLVSGGGAAALRPTLAAIRAGRTIALATKEVLVMAGALVMAEAQAHGVEIRPVDSEHSAIWQCLRGEDPASIAGLVLTASGGPFLRRRPEELRGVAVAEVLRHPRWSMGPKITVDSATMFNKGLELIEAHHLFGVELDRIEVMVHPQSVVHSLVRFIDGSAKAQVGPPDMRVPIALAFSHPRRLPGVGAAVEVGDLSELTFEPLDYDRFPAVGLARRAGRAGGTAPAALNAANEAAVELFLAGELDFTGIVPAVAAVMNRWEDGPVATVEDVLAADAQARARIRDGAKVGMESTSS